MKKIFVLLMAALLSLSLTSCDGLDSILAHFDMDTEDLLMIFDDVIAEIEDAINEAVEDAVNDAIEDAVEDAFGEQGSLEYAESLEEAPVVRPEYDEIRPEFKEQADDYEAFIDEYAAFLKEYNADPTPTEEMVYRYMTLLSEYNEKLGKFSSLKGEAQNDAELEYFESVRSRTEEKLYDVMG